MPSLAEIGTRGAAQEEQLEAMLQPRQTDYWSGVRERFQQLVDNPAKFLAEGIRESFPKMTGDWKKDLDTLDKVLGWTALGPAGIGATVFHGSPHKFSKFSMSKVGTGEGAQAYGHGLYFAERPGVAKSYAGVGQGFEFANGKTGRSMIWEDLHALKNPSPEDYAAKALYSTPNAMEALRDVRYFPNKEVAKQAQELLKMGGKQTKGQVYKVDLPDSAISKMLDWDKPLSQQPESVQKAVNAALDKHLPKAFPEGVQKASNWLPWLRGERADMRGEDIYRALSSGITEQASGMKSATDMFKDVGIPGIKYLDQGSRSSGKGTYNYVVFDENLPKIIGTE